MPKLIKLDECPKCGHNRFKILSTVFGDMETGNPWLCDGMYAKCASYRCDQKYWWYPFFQGGINGIVTNRNKIMD